MNPFRFVKRRPFTSILLVVAVSGGAVFGLYKKRVKIAGLNTAKIYATLDDLSVHAMKLKGQIVGQFASEDDTHKEQAEGEDHKIVVTSPKAQDVVITQPYVCQIHSQQHINVQAYEGGYLLKISVKEGQAVKKGDPLFKIVPTLYQAKLDAENAEARLAQLKLTNTKKLFDTKIGGGSVVSQNEVFLLEAELAHAQAKAELAKAELNFTNITAPFDGIIDRLNTQLGSLIKEGDVLTTLSDNSVMWVYFNVPEAQYLEYMTALGQDKDERQVELMLADGSKFPHIGKIGAIEAKFNNETGNIPFRADFSNPGRLLRHGQTGTVLIRRVLKNAIVIPQRATFEILDKRFVYVVDKDGVVHQREIGIQNHGEMDDIFVIKNGLEVGDRIVLEGMRQIRDGDKVEYEFQMPELVMANLKNKAE